MNIRRTYEYTDPQKWMKLVTLLTRTFFKDGVFHPSKPNGTHYSLPFVKYVPRVLHCFPVDLPDSFHVGADNVLDSYLSEIQYTLNYITDNICTWFARRATVTGPRQQDEPIIPKGELTRLWQERQSEAGEMIHNGSRKTTSSGCSIDKDSVDQHLQTRCQRVLEDVPPPPWRDEVSVQEVTAIISSLPGRRSPGADGVTHDFVKKCKQSPAPIFTAIMNICPQQACASRLEAFHLHACTKDEWRPKQHGGLSLIHI